MNKFMHAV